MVIVDDLNIVRLAGTRTRRESLPLAIAEHERDVVERRLADIRRLVRARAGPGVLRIRHASSLRAFAARHFR